MANKYFRHIYEILLPNLNEDETYKLIKLLFEEISQENFIKFQQVACYFTYTYYLKHQLCQFLFV